MKQFADRVSKMPHEELVSTYQYVSGLFARFQEKLELEDNPRIPSDLNTLKHEIINRLMRVK